MRHTQNAESMVIITMVRDVFSQSGYLYKALGQPAVNAGDVEHSDDVNGDKGATDDVHRHDRSVKVSEVWQESVDDKGDEEAEETDASSNGVENWVSCAQIAIVPKMESQISKGRHIFFLEPLHRLDQVCCLAPSADRASQHHLGNHLKEKYIFIYIIFIQNA